MKLELKGNKVCIICNCHTAVIRLKRVQHILKSLKDVFFSNAEDKFHEVIL